MLNRVFASMAAMAFARRNRPTHRVVGNSKLGRQLRARTSKTNADTQKRRSMRLPHFGEKEQERALRFYMETRFPNGNPRSAPVMLQVSQKRYDAMVLEAEARALEEAKWTSTAASYRAAQEEA